MKIIKRSGAEAIFDANKIAQAVKKANDSVVEAERLSHHQIRRHTRYPLVTGVQTCALPIYCGKSREAVPCSESFLKRGRNTGSCGECHYA